jgi:hypothetical protein
LIPKVGQRGGSPCERSKTSTGKFDSIPPSTSHRSPPWVSLRSRTGSKKNGIDIDARTASTTGIELGSRPSTG